MKRPQPSKRPYTAPHLTCVRLRETVVLMAVSGVGGDVNAGYGGVDDEGTMEPAAKWHLFGPPTFD
jgi:hypothetical protein